MFIDLSFAHANRFPGLLKADHGHAWFLYNAVRTHPMPYLLPPGSLSCLQGCGDSTSVSETGVRQVCQVLTERSRFGPHSAPLHPAVTEMGPCTIQGVC